MTEEFPRVIIVIPTYNSEKNIKKCLDSIFKLNYPNYKVVIVDGHSTDNTLQIAKNYEIEILFEDIGNRAGACNVAIKKYMNEYIAFTDDDCIVSPNWLNGLMETLNSKPNIACATGPNITPEDSSDFSKGVGVVLGSFMGSGYSTHAKIKKEIIEVESAPGCSALYKKNIFDEIGLFDVSLITAEDAEINYRIIKSGYKILYNPEVYVHHYRRDSTKRFLKKMYKYGIGRAKLIKKHPKSMKFYHLLPSVAIISLIPILLLFIFNIIPIVFLYYGLLAIFVLIIMLSFYYAFKNKLYFLIYLFPYLYLVEFVGWSIGFIRGFF